MSDLISKSALVDALAEQAKNMEEVAANAAWMQAVDYYLGMKTGFASAAIMADSAPTIEAIDSSVYIEAVAAAEQRGYNKGLIDGH